MWQEKNVWQIFGIRRGLPSQLSDKLRSLPQHLQSLVQGSTEVTKGWSFLDLTVGFVRQTASTARKRKKTLRYKKNSLYIMVMSHWFVYDLLFDWNVVVPFGIYVLCGMITWVLVLYLGEQHDFNLMLLDRSLEDKQPRCFAIMFRIVTMRWGQDSHTQPFEDWSSLFLNSRRWLFGHFRHTFG